MDLPIPTCIPCGKGQTLCAFGDTIIVHLSGEQTGGKFSFFTSITPPGGGPPPHFHKSEDETFYVLEGPIDFLVDGKWISAANGSVVFAPRGSVHTFRNSGAVPTKMLVTASPAGFEKFFSRCAAEFAKPGAPDMARILAISAEHGISFVD